MLGAIRHDHRISFPKVRTSLDYIRKAFDSEHPLADAKFETDGINLFVERFGKLISASESGQLAVRDLLAAHLKRVEHDDSGLAVRLYPFTRAFHSGDPKIIVIDPFVAFGRATISDQYRRGTLCFLVRQPCRCLSDTFAVVCRNFCCCLSDIFAVVCRTLRDSVPLLLNVCSE